MAAFVLGPAAAAATRYNVTEVQVTAVRQYLDGLVGADVAPEFQAGLLGPLEGPSSGGLVVARTVERWMDGRVNAAPPPDHLEKDVPTQWRACLSAMRCKCATAAMFCQ